MTDAIIIQVLAWGIVVCGAGVIGLACWIALRAFAEQRQDRITNDARHKENLEASEKRHDDIIARMEAGRDRAEARYTEMKNGQDAQFQRFGQQLAGVQDLVVKEIHKLDLRITRVEVWAEGSGLARKRGEDGREND